MLIWFVIWFIDSFVWSIKSIKTKYVYVLRCTSFYFNGSDSRSKTHLRASLLLLTWIHSCRSKGVVNFTRSLRQTWQFQYSYHRMSIPVLYYFIFIHLCPFISPLKRHAGTCSTYKCFTLRVKRHANKVFKQICVVGCLKLSFGECYGQYGNLIQQYDVPFLPNVK